MKKLLILLIVGCSNPSTSIEPPTNIPKGALEEKLYARFKQDKPVTRSSFTIYVDGERDTTTHWSDSLPLNERMIVGKFARFEHKGWGDCGRCGRPWSICEGHTTDYTVSDADTIAMAKMEAKLSNISEEQVALSPSRGCFPLCESCWKELTIEQRLPFYHALYWGRDKKRLDQVAVEWKYVEAAVKDGK